MKSFLVKHSARLRRSELHLQTDVLQLFHGVMGWLQLTMFYFYRAGAETGGITSRQGNI